MKLLLLPLLLAGAGAGWYGLASGDSACPAECDSASCRVTVECTARDTCLVTCYDENDAVVCRREIPCEQPCDKACERPCPSALGCSPAAR